MVLNRKSIMAPLALGSILFCLSGGVSSAATYDAAADFSTTVNPTPTGWSYGYSTSLGGMFNVYTHHDTPDFWGANPQSLNFGTPGVYHIGTATQNGTFNAEANSLDVHPGSVGEYSIVRWTASPTTAGTYDVSAVFRADDIGNTDVHVLGGTAFNGVLGPNAVTTSVSNHQQVTLAAGQSIDFVVGFGPDRNYTGDSTGLKATLTSVPEPAFYQASALLALGGAGLLRLRRRKSA